MSSDSESEEEDKKKPNKYFKNREKEREEKRRKGKVMKVLHALVNQVYSVSYIANSVTHVIENSVLKEISCFNIFCCVCDCFTILT